jgi:peptide/nickel transport system substrate-binding protein
MSKRKILMSFAMLCMLSTAAMADGPKAGGVVNAVIQPEPPSLMVGLVQNGPTQMVAGNIYEGLLRYSPKLDPLPGLAESWTVSEDGKIYTFKLVKGVTWHDGKPFTSADVLFPMNPPSSSR